MKNNASLLFALFLVVGDFLALLAAFVIAYVLRVKVDPRPLIEQIPAFEYFRAFLFVLPLWILVHGFIGLYSQSVYEKRFSEFGRLIVGSFVGILVVIGYDFVTKGDIFPARLVPVYGLVLGFMLLLIFRSCARYVRQLLFRFNYGISNVLIIGDTDASQSIASLIQDTSHTGQYVVGIVGKNISGLNHYETFAAAIQHIRRPIHSIIQTELYRDQDKNNEILRHAQEHHISYRFVPGNSDLFVGNIQVELFAGLPVVAVHQTALIGWGRIVKRLFDLVITTTLLFFLWPILLLISILQKLFDFRSPVFFKQTRLTRFNREFKVYKFRTLVPKYNGLLPEEGFAKLGKPELAEQFRANGDYLPNDPRLSKFGLFLRRTSLDELPQLFNVILGDLSLVGPRALVPRELNAYEKKHAILSVKSGLTGLAQISGRKEITFEERRSLDVYYVQNWSFWWDLVILLKTIRAVITGAGSK
jgi:exopolysaccharide biosynthesis polyprenyl glycosylphosphotransferase